MIYQYKMTQISSHFVIQNATGEGSVAAERLEKLVNDYAKQGWEFYRIDTVNVSVQPGWWASIRGQRSQTAPYCIVTFRKERKITALPKQDDNDNIPFPTLDEFIE